MIENKTITIQEGGVRLDAAVLLACPSSTRAFVRDAIASGDILISDAPRGKVAENFVDAESFPRQKTHPPLSPRRAIKGLKLAPNTQIFIRKLFEASDNLVQPEPDSALRKTLVTCFEDDALLAFDKPAGRPVQPLSCRETGTLMNAVVARYPECAPLGDRPLMAGALHRIDADTSGLVLVARTAKAFENLRAQFTAQTVRKTYLALVEGSVAVGGKLENDLIHDPTLPFCRMIDVRRLRSEVKGSRSKDERALHAVTEYRPIGYTTVENEERTLLEVTIFTGVTHQIRAQLALAGMHIINDRLYGAFAIENQTGHCLHALAARFLHPLTNQEMEIRTALPPWARFAGA